MFPGTRNQGCSPPLNTGFLFRSSSVFYCIDYKWNFPALRIFSLEIPTDPIFLLDPNRAIP